MINKHIIIARGGEQRSKLEIYFQAIGARTISFPILKGTEIKLTDDDLEKIMKGQRLIFLNPTSIAIFFGKWLKSNFHSNFHYKSNMYQENQKNFLSKWEYLVCLHVMDKIRPAYLVMISRS